MLHSRNLVGVARLTSGVVTGFVGIAIVPAIGMGVAGCVFGDDTSVGKITRVVDKTVYLGKTEIEEDEELSAKSMLKTDSRGQVHFTLVSGTDCTTFSKSRLQIEPRRGIRIRFLAGTSWCSKKPEAPKAPYIAGEGKNETLITAKGTVFSVAVQETGTVVQVTSGFVEVEKHASKEPVLVGPQQEAQISAGRSIRVEEANLTAEETEITDSLAEPLREEPQPPSNLSEIAPEGRLVAGIDSSGSEAVKSFLRRFIESLGAAWDVEVSVEAAPVEEGQRRLDEGRIGILAAAAEPSPTRTTVSLFTQEQTTWNLMISPNTAFEQALRAFLADSLGDGSYGQLYIDAFGSQPAYAPKGGGVLVELGRALPGTLFSTPAPADHVVEADGSTGARVDYPVPDLRPTASGARVSCSPGPDSLFDLGTTVVTCLAETTNGVEEQVSFRVTVRDRQGPRLVFRGERSYEADSKDGAQVEFTVDASDLVDGQVDVGCSSLPGSRLPVGDHQIECKATDKAGNSTRNMFEISVYDAAPLLTVPNELSQRYARPTGTKISYTVTASDGVDGRLQWTCQPPSGFLFAVGTTRVKCSTTDSAKQKTVETFDVKIIDDIPPFLPTPESVVVRAPRGSRTHAVTFVTPSADDAVDESVPVTCDPPSGSAFTVGERTRVRCRARDRFGNATEKSFFVTVRDGSS